MKLQPADRLSGPWCVVLPAFAVGTNSRSGSNTAETEQNLQTSKVSVSICKSESKLLSSQSGPKAEGAPYFGRDSRI